MTEWQKGRDEMTDISIPVDDTVKQEAEMICEELGMDLSIATNLFYKN